MTDDDEGAAAVAAAAAGPKLSEAEMLAVVEQIAARLERRRRAEMQALALSMSVIVLGVVSAFWLMSLWPDKQLQWLLFIPLALGGLILKSSTWWARRAMRSASQPARPPE